MKIESHPKPFVLPLDMLRMHQNVLVLTTQMNAARAIERLLQERKKKRPKWR